MDWLKTLAPTVATSLLGPLGGIAVSALGDALGISDATQANIADAIKSGTLTPEQISAIKKMELDYKAKESELGFKYADLAFQDRDSARKASVAGSTQKPLFWLSLLLLVFTLGIEAAVLFNGYPSGTSEIVVGRVLGLMDAVAMVVISYWYGTSSGSAQKSELLAAAPAK